MYKEAADHSYLPGNTSALNNEEQLRVGLTYRFVPSTALLLLFGPRYRQLRVKGQSCRASSNALRTGLGDGDRMCYPAYTELTRDRTDFGAGDHFHNHEEPPRFVNQGVFTGEFGLYPLGGHIVDVPINTSGFRNSLSKMDPPGSRGVGHRSGSGGFIDEKTRVIFIEMALYSIPTKYFIKMTVREWFSVPSIISFSLLLNSQHELLMFIYNI